MTGINYIINEQGKKVAVMLDLTEYGAIWEDFYEKLTSSARSDTKEIKSGKRKKDFFNFIEHHSYKLPADYKFNREELYER
ncbi:MAG: hypothetical protein A2275_11265 [Bacteroidetes bacterium RIFOXYA12_FULL_35_11]|nr:MAG: hypothetical protein A2X01_19210 [Bacteroidetes bacterium GWF2_35_48]OFY74419.1 MAG: hypothetical protein A2275_11265 [Bacteroidetes bacterium RIFOXYA12_FULL_35_11]OFY96453.1 MAG: hypothetical protein A2309_12195 [Bacteroidetes bacterium RIFOXYB2_FULL_35_7]OFZ00584.1 MAG: hypothetical protein A2491_17445 [Bacteroidetes bacterium RIFOXYC12_FULL_35_7]HBX50704.1 hypothetical protein [Bacteroidales bacterium]